MCKKNAPNHICVKFGALSTESLIVSVFGGGKEIRTPDPLLARQVLYQLSYTPRYKLIKTNRVLDLNRIKNNISYP